MFCGKCGAKNESGAAFCYACGAPLKTAEGPAAESGSGAAPAAPQNSGRHKKIGIAAVAAAAVVVIFVVFSLFGGRGDKAAAEQFFDAVFDGDAAAIVDLVPKGLVNTMIEESGYSREEVAEEFGQMADYLNSSVDALKVMGSGVDIDLPQLHGDGRYGNVHPLDSQRIVHQPETGSHTSQQWVARQKPLLCPPDGVHFFAGIHGGLYPAGVIHCGAQGVS